MRVLDATAWRCPRPVIELARLVGSGADGLADGEQVTVLHTDPAAPGDIAAWCRIRGHQLVASGDTSSLVRVCRTPPAAATAGPSPTGPGTPPG